MVKLVRNVAQTKSLSLFSGGHWGQSVIFLGLILLASKRKRGGGGVRGPSPGKIFILRWLKAHFLKFWVFREWSDKKSENGKNITLTLWSQQKKKRLQVKHQISEP